ncbi:hypothetical protein [Phytohabitans houttuyneae]|uniref:Bacterial transcriptional activator domain-containing protein n=1 Tax=Phytohabitans houttuyneae TaxID=1076126 RepID=A0A6V8KF67_9ACTN|nr:hypothetical protein [Phytohabitans houttuyneae]GFJ82090.1 hypothetical protein Phou_062700 [Phytohabitans houttuyneae]
MQRTRYRLHELPGYVLLFVAPPVALVGLLGWPLPDQVPSRTQWQAWLAEPLTWHSIVAAATIAGWLMWGIYAATAVCEVYRWMSRGRRLPRLSIPGPLQALSAAVLGSTAISASASGAAQASAALVDAGLSQPAQPHPDRHLATTTTAARPALTVATVANAVPTSATDRQAPIIGLLAASAPSADAASGLGTSATGAEATRTAARYQARPGDWLWHIADRFLGDPRRYPDIAALNPHLAAEHGAGFPDHIEPGDLLILPADARDRGPRPHATGSVRPPRPTPPATDTPHEPGPARPDPSPRHGQPSKPPDQPAPAGSASARPSATNSATTPADDQTGAAPGWIQLAGGCIGVGFAAGLVYAAATVYKRRRHRHRPTTTTASLQLPEAESSAALTTVTGLRRMLRRHAPHLLDPPVQTAPTVREYRNDPVGARPPQVGPTGSELAGIGDLPAHGGLGLTGPGATDAARAILAATLTAGRLDDPDAQSRAVVTQTALSTLLSHYADQAAAMRRLTVSASFADALTTIEEEIIRRSRIVADHESTDVATLRASDPLAEPLPQLLLIAERPDDSWHRRLATAITLGGPVDVGAVVIGHWPPGTTLTVAADGTTDTDPARVAVLDAAAAHDILTVLAEAHGDTPPEANQRQPAPASPNQSESTPGQPDRPDGTDPATPPATGGTTAAVRILGVPAILGPDGTAVRGLRAKALELLVYLAVHRSGAALGDIMEAVWGDATTRRAAERLSTCVANLRSVLRAAAQHEKPDQDAAGQRIDPVVNTGGRYHLDPTLVHVDWWTVLDACTQAAAAGDDTTRLTHLRTATAAVGGALAENTDYEWIDTDRELVRRRLVTIYLDTARLLADTDPHQARTLLDQACHLDPLSDSLARHAIRAAARLGDTDAIRHRLSILRRELDDTGIDIDPETEQLAADLLHQLADATATTAAQSTERTS